MRSWIPLTAFAAAATLLSSCASAQLHYIQEEATAALKEEQTVICMGLMARSSNLVPAPAERSRILNDLETRLKQKRKRLIVASHGTFERRAGKIRSHSSGSANQVSYALSASQRNQAREMGADFGLVVVLDGNETWCDVDEDYSEEEIHKYDKEGNVISCRVEKTFTTTSSSHRKARATYLLYDLESGSKIWEASSNYTECHSRSSCSAHCYPPAPPHPEPPCLHDVMKNMAAAAVRKFPK